MGCGRGGFTALKGRGEWQVIRLFKKLESLKKVLRAVAASTLPVLNAFVVLTIVSSLHVRVVSLVAGAGAGGGVSKRR